jgi:mevalonate kinase
MVDAVARMRERRPETTQRAFDAIHTLVKNARLAIEAADRTAVGQLLDLNQMLLSGLFVSTPEIEQMCSLARAAGALGAKLTGAGGGGCVVALVDHPDVGAKVLAAWKNDGFDGFLTTFGATEPVRRSTPVMETAP